MYLFARTRTCAPDRIAEATAFAVDIAAKASTISGSEIAAWQVQYGAPATTFIWTTVTASHTDMGTRREKLLADNGYIETVQAAEHLFEGAAEDLIADVVASPGDGGHEGQYASFISAQCATGRIADAMLWGVEMANHANKVTGRDGLFTRSMFGPWATVGWFSLAGSLEELDEATAALAADPDYLVKVDSAADLFLPGSGDSRLSQRIG